MKAAPAGASCICRRPCTGTLHHMCVKQHQARLEQKAALLALSGTSAAFPLAAARLRPWYHLSSCCCVCSGCASALFCMSLAALKEFSAQQACHGRLQCPG
jgi:hypothetical protein